MSYKITDDARQYFAGPNIDPNIVLEIEGFSDLFGANIVQILRRFGDDIFFGDPGLLFGVPQPQPGGEDWVSLSGTTQTISAQLEPDKGGATSTQQMTLNLIDYNSSLSDLFYPATAENELIYRNAVVYLGPKQGAFPDDYIIIFSGKITQVAGKPGSIALTVSHPEELKKSEVFIQASSRLATDLKFQNAVIQDLTFQQTPDFVGTVQVEFKQFTGIPPGQNPNITVIGNLIEIEIESGVTLAKNIKKRLNSNPDGVLLATAVISGDGNAAQVAQAPVTLTTSSEIELDTVEGWLTPQAPDFRTYARIGDEIVQYTGINTLDRKLTGCTRASLTSLGQNHEIGSDVTSFYRLGDGTFENSNAIDLSLKVLLSGASQYWRVDAEIFSFVLTEPSQLVPNAIFFRDVDVSKRWGVTAGDEVTITGAINPGNNVTLVEIIEVVRTLTGSYIVIDATLSLETDTAALCSFRSRFNVLPDGVGLTPEEVDVEQFLRIKQTYGSQIGIYDLYLKETPTTKDLINEMIFLPSGLYSVPRKGRVSVAITAPPLYDPNNVAIDLASVINPSGLNIERSISKNFYNTVIYKFNEDSVEDRLLDGRVFQSADSTARIKAPNKVLTIEAKGFRPNPTTELLIQRNATRFLDRYRFAAESISVQVPFKVGWTMEVADTVLFGDPRFQLPDSVKGGRDFVPRIFEITNKEMNWKTGLIRITLTDTNYNVPVRYVVFSPASKINTGSTTSVIRLKRSFGYSFDEPRKWENFIGYGVKIRSPDFSTVYQSTILDFVDGDNTALQISPVATAPGENWIMELENYDDISAQDGLLKSIFGFFDPVVGVTSGVSATEFNVDDPSVLFVGASIYVHNASYSNKSPVVKVEAIAGPLITVSAALGFTPSSGDKVQLIGFASDQGQAYAWL